jgi:hypothetical protein
VVVWHSLIGIGIPDERLPIVQENVFGFDVAMNDTMPMCVAERREYAATAAAFKVAKLLPSIAQPDAEASV